MWPKKTLFLLLISVVAITACGEDSGKQASVEAPKPMKATSVPEQMPVKMDEQPPSEISEPTVPLSAPPIDIPENVQPPAEILAPEQVSHSLSEKPDNAENSTESQLPPAVANVSLPVATPPIDIPVDAQPPAEVVGSMQPVVVEAIVAGSDYLRAKWHPIHFKPHINSATDEQCLTCHQEVLKASVREESPAGVKAVNTLAWYQTLDTYEGEQDTFHRRHLVTPYSQKVMSMRCNTCHQGNDPREETANSSATGSADLTQRKHVDPMICAMCHGKHNAEVMGIPPGDWWETGKVFNNNCMLCHAAIRTNRHQVNYLNADAIEAAAKESSDVCFGCHGGRAWYRIKYPYPRHEWPGAGGVVPDWAKDRPTESELRFRVGSQTAVSN